MNLAQKQFELAFITACRQNKLKAAYVIFTADGQSTVRIAIGGEEMACALTKRIFAAGEHVLGIGSVPQSGAQARLEALFRSIEPGNQLREDWNTLKQELHRLRGSLEALVKVEGEPMERWPRFWPIQDEQGGCVLCGAGSVTEPVQSVELHEPQCGFRRAYEALLEMP